MRILLFYRLICHGDEIVRLSEDDKLLQKEVTLDDNATIRQILPSISAKALARYSSQDENVIGPYLSDGPLENGRCYFILSADVKATIRAMS